MLHKLSDKTLQKTEKKNKCNVLWCLKDDAQTEQKLEQFKGCSVLLKVSNLISRVGLVCKTLSCDHVPAYVNVCTMFTMSVVQATECTVRLKGVRAGQRIGL